MTGSATNGPDPSGLGATSPDQIKDWVDYISKLLHTEPDTLQAILGLFLALALVAAILLPVIRFFNAFFEKQLKKEESKKNDIEDPTSHPILIEYRLKLDLLNEEKRNLQSKIDRCGIEYSKDLENYRRELRDLKHQYFELKGEFERAKGQLELREGEAKALRRDYAKLREDYDKLQKDLTRAETLLEMQKKND